MLLLRPRGSCPCLLLAVGVRVCERRPGWRRGRGSGTAVVRRRERQRGRSGSGRAVPDVAAWPRSSSPGFPPGSGSKTMLFPPLSRSRLTNCSLGQRSAHRSTSFLCGFLRELIFILVPDGCFTQAVENIHSLSKYGFGLKTSLR